MDIDGLGGVDIVNGKLWGSSGGELEYVGQRIEWRKQGPVLVLLLTDHDHWPGDKGEIEPGVFYRTEFPLTARNIPRPTVVTAKQS